VTRELTVGVGAAALTTADVVLSLGRHHPATHGSLRLALTLDGDRVATAEPVVGHMHRGAEKLFEVRDYRQVVVLANRHDWLSAFSNELGVVLAVERMLGLDVPPRAVWLRTLLAELNRVVGALVFLGSLPGGPLPDVYRAQAAVQLVMEEASGGRVHHMLNRVGGLKEEVPAGWTGRVRAAVAGVRPVAAALTAAVREDEAFASATRGVGVLAPGAVLSYGVSGPIARASGVDMDLRRDEPYLAYGELGFGSPDLPVVLGTAGDAADRWACLVGQVEVSLDVVEASLDQLPGGPVNVRLPKTVRAPEGSTYAQTENPLGRQGYYLVSRGERTPWRLAMRTASFANVQALRVLLPGVRLADLPATLASTFFVVGDVDK
jgi:NADH-quinone oxidoreductase subunit D